MIQSFRSRALRAGESTTLNPLMLANADTHGRFVAMIYAALDVYSPTKEKILAHSRHEFSFPGCRESKYHATKIIKSRASQSVWLIREFNNLRQI